jgi:hypothetical protein
MRTGVSIGRWSSRSRGKTDVKTRVSFGLVLFERVCLVENLFYEAFKQGPKKKVVKDIFRARTVPVI